MNLFSKHILLLCLLFVSAFPLGAQTSSLTLQIVSQGTHKSIDSAEVEILKHGIKAISNQYGNVKIKGIKQGFYLVAIRHPNFEDQTISFTITPGINIRETITLIPQLEEVVVTETREDRILEDQGFNHRREVGFGTYITREEVKKKGRLDMTDVLRGIPGINLQRYDSRLIASVNRASSKTSTTPCALDVFVDGYNVGGSPPDLNLIATPAEVAAVEVYKGPATLPARFNRFNSCGAIVIWTKMTIKED